MLLLVSACSSEQAKKEEINWQLSPAFESSNLIMRGMEGRIAIIDMPLTAGKTEKYAWHFWGTVDDVTGKLTIFGSHQESGRKETVVPSTFIIPAKPINGADNHFVSMTNLPSPGLWKLDAYIDDGLFGSIIVEVK